MSLENFEEIVKKLPNSSLGNCLCNPDKEIVNYRILLAIDTAIQLKEKGYSEIIAIKNAGIPVARLFEKVGYNYHEIYYSHHKKRMINPEMDLSSVTKLKNKKAILADIDFIYGETLDQCKIFLEDTTKDLAAYITRDYWTNDTNIDLKDWITTETGVRKFKENGKYPLRKLPKDLEIYTSTDWDFLEQATQRVFNYVNSIEK